MWDLCREAVGKYRAVCRDKARGGDFGGELFVDVHLFVRSRSGMCLFSLTADMLPEWVGSLLPGFHTPSLFPNGSPTL